MIEQKVEDRDGVESAGQSDLPTYVDTNLPRGDRFCFPASEDFDLLPVVNEDLPAVEAKDLPGAEDKNPATAETVNGPPSAPRLFSNDSFFNNHFFDGYFSDKSIGIQNFRLTFFPTYHISDRDIFPTWP